MEGNTLMDIYNKTVQYDGAISLDGEQLGDMSIQLIDDINTSSEQKIIS